MHKAISLMDRLQSKAVNQSKRISYQLWTTENKYFYDEIGLDLYYLFVIR